MSGISGNLVVAKLDVGPATFWNYTSSHKARAGNVSAGREIANLSCGACLASAAGVKVLERCLACEADFERVARDTLAMADKCEADVSRANGGPDLTPSDAFWV